jgi:hypothetical protein
MTNLSYSESDLAYNSEVCKYAQNNDLTICNENKNKHKRYLEVSNKQSAAKQRYDDMISNTYREIQFTLNILVGIGLMSYYVYNLPKNIAQA